MLNTAWLIHDAVAVEGVSAYLYWALIWPPASGGSPTNWLVTVEDPTTGSFTTPNGYQVNDPYYALKHYAKWIDEGWVRVDATSTTAAVKASAFVSPDGRSLTAVIVNTDVLAHAVVVSPAATFTVASAAGYRSSGTTERTAALALAAGQAVAMPGHSIVTVTLAE
jgi:O-glycosyl hydrolase